MAYSGLPFLAQIVLHRMTTLKFINLNQMLEMIDAP